MDRSGRDHRGSRRLPEQIEGLLEGGVDLLLFETASDLDELMVAVEEARASAICP